MSSSTTAQQTTVSAAAPVQQTTFRILFAISLVHLLNDSIQSVIPAIFPVLKESMHLSYTQVGLIGFVINAVASVMQPVVGLYTDKRPSPFLLPFGMFSTFLGMLALAFAPNYISVLLAVALVGIGSAVFHPEGSRVAYMAAGPRRGLAQSIYQVGGNAGQSLAPIMTALIFIPLGQFGSIWFTLVAGTAILVLMYVARWYRVELAATGLRGRKSGASKTVNPKRRSAVRAAMLVLLVFVFARSWYNAAIAQYYPFFLREFYGITIETAQYFIFAFLAAGALGTFFGGPLADRFGKRNVMIFSMLASAPLALLLPYMNLVGVAILLGLIGFIALSSFSVTVVYAQELMPGNVGTVSGLVIGLAFGLGAIGSAALGKLADIAGLQSIIQWAAFLPIIGLVVFFVPSDRRLKQWNEEETA
ncbi:MFS transporter [Paenibacillus turpanensis]|uniref:MFS transporter n=1 Tax=Paenibacillus turpanensis TaxID=2689078 RepID=UPI00140C176B|nr:MFS transporter [Paenibacillus turpanensis]